MMATKEVLTPSEVSTYYSIRVPALKMGPAREWRGPCPVHKGEGDNFAVVPSTGQWFCHSSCGIGGDIFSLEQRLYGTNFKSAKKTIFEMIGRSRRLSSSESSTQGSSSPRSARTPSGGGARSQGPILASRVWEALISDGFRLTTSFDYGPDLRKARFEHTSQKQPDKNRPEKTFRWEHRVGENWHSGDGGMKKPLYVNQIFRDHLPVGLAVGFEGEAKVDLAGSIGLAAFSFKDISPERTATLEGCDVVLWPDNDPSGNEQASKAAQIIVGSGQPRTVSIIHLPHDFPAAGDLVDAVENLKWDADKIMGLVKTATPFKGERISTSECGGQVAEPEETWERSVANRSEYTRFFPFLIQPDGIFFKKDSEESSEPVRISSRIDVVAKTRNERGEDWGRVLAWHDEEGHSHQWAMPMEALASDAAGVRGQLLSGGLPFITTNSRMRERFSQYLQTAPVHRYIRCVSRIGWSGPSFVLPDLVIGPKHEDELLYQPAGGPLHHNWRTRGTVEQWKEHVGQLCSGNSRLIIAASCAFAGPLLGKLGAESGGIHFHGGSSTGKSTALIVGGSVCGGGGKSGFVQTWRSTINGLEAMAEGHNDSTLFLDELAQVDPRSAAEAAYMLGNGQGKSRMTKGLGARPKLNWNLFVVSSGELTMAEHAATTGGRTRAGVEVRLVNIEADAGKGMGLIEVLHGESSSSAFVQRLKDASQRYFGAAFRTFLGILTNDASAAERAFAKAQRALREILPEGAAGELARVADRFALIGAAGDLATGWGLTGWAQSEATDSAKRCLSDWIHKRGTASSSDVEGAIRQLRAFLGSHGSSRFEALNDMANSDSLPRTINRAGYKRINGEKTEFLIFPEVFRGEICQGYSPLAVAKELSKRQFLVREDHSLMIKPRLPELGPTRVYCILASVLEEEEC
jgi:putative DNA primase/helicase